MQINLRDINQSSISINGIGSWISDDRYHFYDAYIDYAEWHDGTPLTADELEALAESDGVEEVIASRQSN